MQENNIKTTPLRITALICAACMILLAGASAGCVTHSYAAQSSIKVYVDGHQLETEVSPEIKNNITFVPMRAIFECLGADVTWNGARKDIRAEKGFRTILLKINSRTGIVNSEVSELAAAPYIKSGSTMIPLRFVSEAVDCDVSWNASERRVDISTGSNSLLEDNNKNDSQKSDDKEQPSPAEKTDSPASILGDTADITYDDAFARAVRSSAACISARLSLSQAEQQSDEFNDMYSQNYTFTILQNRKDLQLLTAWQEKNVIVTEEQTAFQTRTAMDAISLKLVEIEDQKADIAYAKKKQATDQLKYNAGMLSFKDLTAGQNDIASAEKKLASLQTELDSLYISLYGKTGLDYGDRKNVEFRSTYSKIGDVDMLQAYNDAVANDPYIWYVEHALENADFKLQTYEWNMGGKSYYLTKIDLQNAANNENTTKKNLRNALESRYNQIIQIENNISMLEDQQDTLMENIDTMRTLYDNGLKSKNDLEAVLQNERTLTYNILNLKISHEQLKATFEKPYLNPSYMSAS